MPINFGKAEFSRSAGTREQFLWDGLPQFAFAGRSNVGKSSVINRLLGRKNLAYVGSSPGKTTQVNYFLVDGRAYLVDLPGYGYAKVSKAEKGRGGRRCSRETGCPEIVVANKLDKLKKSQIEPALALIRETLELGEGDVLLPFSAEKGTGKEELIRLLNAAVE